MHLSQAQRRLLQSLDSEQPRLIPGRQTRTADTLWRAGYIRSEWEPKFGFVLTERGLQAVAA